MKRRGVDITHAGLWRPIYATVGAHWDEGRWWKGTALDRGLIADLSTVSGMDLHYRIIE